MNLHRESEAYWCGYNAAIGHIFSGQPFPDAPDDFSDEEQEDWNRGASDAQADS